MCLFPNFYPLLTVKLLLVTLFLLFSTHVGDALSHCETVKTDLLSNQKRAALNFSFLFLLHSDFSSVMNFGFRAHVPCLKCTFELYVRKKHASHFRNVHFQEKSLRCLQ